MRNFPPCRLEYGDCKTPQNFKEFLGYDYI